eukprot:6751581-Ditylum_brightwellii.AAC.1
MEGLAMEYIDEMIKVQLQMLHTEKLLKLLLDSNRIKKEQSIVMEDTDGCSTQYRSASSLYLFSTVCMNYGIMIDHTVGAPGHGIYVVDGLNAVDKRFLRMAMLRNSIPEEHNN